MLNIKSRDIILKDKKRSGDVLMSAFMFDMDGLLVDSERLMFDSWKKVAEMHGLEGIEVLFPKFLGVNKATRKSLFESCYGASQNFEKCEDEVKEIATRTESESPTPLKRGAKELLSYLKSKQFKLGLASSSSAATIARRTKDNGIDIFFDAVVSGEHVKKSKPDPEIFLTCAEKLGENPDECTVFEDSFNGIKAAHSAKMRPVMIPDLIEPDEYIKSLAYAIYPSLEDVKNDMEKGKLF